MLGTKTHSQKSLIQEFAPTDANSVTLPQIRFPLGVAGLHDSSGFKKKIKQIKEDFKHVFRKNTIDASGS